MTFSTRCVGIPKQKERKYKTGRNPYDVIFAFKVSVLQRTYNRAHEQTECQIHDSYSFCRLVCVSPEEWPSDARMRDLWIAD